MRDIREYLKERVLLFDGAMGTLLSDSAQAGTLPELLSVTDGARIRNIHEAYINAGASAIKTNTFGLNRRNIAEDECIGAIEAAFGIADEFSDRAYAFADIGPVSAGGEDALDEYIFVADAFLRCGAKYFIFETNSTSDGLLGTAEHIKKICPEAYIIISFASLPDGFTRSGKAVSALLSEAAESPYVDAIGLNCASGARHMSALVSRLKLPEKTLCVMPNAGYPTVLGNRTFYEGSPEYFARELAGMVHLGARIIGGCCGTRPEHISRSASALISSAPRHNRSYENKRPAQDEAIRVSPASIPDDFYEQLCDKSKRPFAVELDPPENADMSRFMAGAMELYSGGASILTIADCPIARARVDSSLLACKVKREIGMNVLPHMTCRDRNLNAIKALLLGLAGEGVHNILTVTGDPIPSAERSEVKSVYNFNSRMLAEYITALGESLLSTPFRIYGALNVNARNFDMQLKIAEEKVKNGVCAFLTQPILTEEAFANLKRARASLDARIVGGIFPLVSYKNARFMSSEVAGVRVDERITELYRDKTRGQACELALDISCEIASRIYPFVDGYYIMTPFSRTPLVCSIMSRIREICKDK